MKDDGIVGSDFFNKGEKTVNLDVDFDREVRDSRKVVTKVSELAFDDFPFL